MAGPNWGSHFTPRIGDEVLVECLDGEPDRLMAGAAAHGIGRHDLAAWTDYTASVDQTYTDPVNGQPPHKHRPGNCDPGDPVERFSQTVVHLDAPAPAIFATPASSVHYAAMHRRPAKTCS